MSTFIPIIPPTRRNCPPGSGLGGVEFTEKNGVPLPNLLERDKGAVVGDTFILTITRQCPNGEIERTTTEWRCVRSGLANSTALFVRVS